MINKFMKIAVDEAFKGMRAEDGGPFGAVIVKDGEIIAVGTTTLLSQMIQQHMLRSLLLEKRQNY